MMWSAVAAIVQAVLGALFSALRIRWLDREYDAAQRGLAVDEAALETQEAIHDIADARAGLPDSPANPDALARELRAERRDAGAGRDPATSQRRPF
jgi:hypothetical protein